MTGLTAVTDANTLIGLAKGGVFDRLAPLFVAVAVPPSVVEEVVVNGQGRPGAQELAQALGVWITEVTPDPRQLQPFSPTLSLADRQVLAVAQAVAADYILTDDRDLRREASTHQLACLRTAELVVLMKEQGLLPEVKAVLDQMQQAQHGIAPAVYEQVLRTAGEWPDP